MPVTEVITDLAARTLTVTSEWDAPVGRVWELWSDPRRLERWWGPPTHPATFVLHDLRPGGVCTYYMTGPDGTAYHGWWDVLAVEEHRSIGWVDGFADAAGNRDTEMPSTAATVTFTTLSSGSTQMVLRSEFASTAAMQRLLEMGMQEGLASAMGQIQGVLDDR